MMTIDERSITAIYAAPTLAETIRRIADVPIEKMETPIRKEYLSTLQKLREMTAQEYQTLDLKDVLVVDEDDELGEVEENA